MHMHIDPKKLSLMLDKKVQTVRLSGIHGKQFCPEPMGPINRKGIPFGKVWDQPFCVYEQLKNGRISNIKIHIFLENSLIS